MKYIINALCCNLYTHSGYRHTICKHIHFKTELTIPKDKHYLNYSLTMNLKGLETYFLNHNLVMFANIYQM